MDNWQRTFSDKLSKVQTQWVRQFEEAIEAGVAPVYEDLSAFLREQGIRVSTPLLDEGRRSYKFELSENAYLLMIFRYTGVGEFELRTECFVPGGEPVLTRNALRLSDVDDDWTRRQFQAALDAFIDLLSGSKFRKAEEAVLTV